MSTSSGALVEHLAARFGVELEGSVLESKLDPRYPVKRVVAEDVVLEVAATDEGRRRLRLEASGRRWAAGHAIATPEVLEADPDGAWMVSRWVSVSASGGSDYVVAAVEAADRICAATDLPPGAAESTSWASSRRSLVGRGLRSVAGGVPVRLWRSTKRQLAELDHPVDVAHGDFYPRNVLGTHSHCVMVVDWEYAGYFPRHTDLARMWAVLRDAGDRRIVLDRALQGADGQERRRVGTLLLWHSLRLLGENLSAPRAHREADNLAHARAMVPQASRLAEELGAWPL